MNYDYDENNALLFAATFNLEKQIFEDFRPTALKMDVVFQSYWSNLRMNILIIWLQLSIHHFS